MESVFDRLKRCRIKLGLNQAEMASIMDISQRDISELEAGKKKFIPTEYIQYLNNQGFSLDWIFNGGPDNLMKRTYQWIHSQEENSELSMVGERDGEYYKIDLSNKEITLSKEEYLKFIELAKLLDESKPLLKRIKRQNEID
jgi:transcriptional regulator with XRE-family HTH domain